MSSCKWGGDAFEFAGVQILPRRHGPATAEGSGAFRLGDSGSGGSPPLEILGPAAVRRGTFF